MRRAPQRYFNAAIPPAPASKKAAEEAMEAQGAEAEAEATRAEEEEEEEDDESPFQIEKHHAWIKYRNFASDKVRTQSSRDVIRYD